MSDISEAYLRGYYNPTGEVPSFLTPLFTTQPRGNACFVQMLDDAGRVEGFTSTKAYPEADLVVSAALLEHRQGLGDEGFWAFKIADGAPIVAGRASEVKRQLAELLDDPRLTDNIYVHFDVVRFVGDPDREAQVLLSAFARKEDERGREKAEFWRDYSILLPEIKLGLRGMAPGGDKAALFQRFVSDTSLQVDGKTPYVTMRQGLFDDIARRAEQFRAAMATPDRLAGVFALEQVEPQARAPRAKSAPAPEPAPEPAAEPTPAPSGRGGRRNPLLLDLRRLLKLLEEDIRYRLNETSNQAAALEAEWQDAQEAGRTATPFGEWREGEITQAAVHWVLTAVFVRFLEDNHLIDQPWLSGATPELMGQVRERHEAFFRAFPHQSDRDYLLQAFGAVESLPGMAALFDRRHNPIWRLELSGDGAREVLSFFRAIDPITGRLLRDFTRPDLDTRFLGDLYQDLSEAARDRYALLQTPDFVEEFILDRTLEPALREFGLKGFRVIDPTCGSGHFLLGAFRRLLDHGLREEPGLLPRAQVQRALEGVYGVDINPFAVAIARFRLMIAALNACGLRKLTAAPDFKSNLAIGDSLLHGRHFGRMDLGAELDNAARSKVLRHVYHAEDAEQLARILGQQYHAVVGNPPYITVKDAALNRAYRENFSACHRAYALSVPFIERFFDLALDGRRAGEAGHIGLIVANSFMKREFGSKLIEQLLPTLDLTHVVDTAGAYIPGHGTPTCLLFGRNRAAVGDTVRGVLGKTGEPGRPDDPAQGKVWRAIVDQIDAAGSESEFVSVANLPRKLLAKHPWSLGGGGAVELKEKIEAACKLRLKNLVDTISSICITREDDAYIMPRAAIKRRGIEDQYIVQSVLGEDARDYVIHENNYAIFPYDENLNPIDINASKAVHMALWPVREHLWRRKELNGDHRQTGRTWWEWNRFLTRWHRRPLSIAFAFVATHNHFVFDRGGKVFNRSVPVIKLSTDTTEAEHLILAGLLNSSIACFWMKQIMHDKGGQGVSEGFKSESWEKFFEFTVAGLQEFPLPTAPKRQGIEKLFSASTLVRCSGEINRLNLRIPYDIASDSPGFDLPEPGKTLQILVERAIDLAKMIGHQEESDWYCYHLYGLTDEPLTWNSMVIHAGERAFEIALARQVAAGEAETSWFERHGATPITELPAHWPEDYRRIVEKRLDVIASNPFINLIERPEYKRRWAMEPLDEQEKAARKSWLLDRLEDPRYWSHGDLISVASLADLALADAEFLQVAKLYENRDDVDVPALVANLVAAESVPFLPVLRYTDSGLRKRVLWEETWALQRREDEFDAHMQSALESIGPEEGRPALKLGDSPSDNAVLGGRWGRGDEPKVRQKFAEIKAREVGTIPVPPKYRSADFQSGYWRLRGALDVPKERFVSYPFASRDSDGTLMVGWAGWSALQQARALSAHYLVLKDQDGWPAERLMPLLLGLLELVPWLKQWHNDLDPAFGARMGDYFEDFVALETRELHLTPDSLRPWTPPTTTRRTRKR